MSESTYSSGKKEIWAPKIELVLFALIEIVLFVWIFGIDNAWKEMHHGAELRIPRIFRWIIQFVTPIYLIALLRFWGIQEGEIFIVKSVFSPYYRSRSICI